MGRLINSDDVEKLLIARYEGEEYIREDIRRIPTARIEDRWIPVEERMPEKPNENPLYDNKPLEIYLVSVKNTDCVIRAFWNGASFTDGWEKLDVLAWMPLPEPFNPQY